MSSTQRRASRESFIDDRGRARAAAVLKGSTRRKVEFRPLAATPRECRALQGKWIRAQEALERRTRARRVDENPTVGIRNGALGEAVAVYRALCSFQNHETGELYPTWDTIAERAALSRETVGRGLDTLEEFGSVARINRCVANDTPFGMEQTSNAYILLGPAHWRNGLKLCFEDLDPPPPDDWSDAWTMGEPLEEMKKAIAVGGALAIGQTLEAGVVDADPRAKGQPDKLDAATLRLWRRTHPTDRQNE